MMYRFRFAVVVAATACLVFLLSACTSAEQRRVLPASTPTTTIGPALDCHTGPTEHPQPTCTYKQPGRVPVTTSTVAPHAPLKPTIHVTAHNDGTSCVTWDLPAGQTYEGRTLAQWAQDVYDVPASEVRCP